MDLTPFLKMLAKRRYAKLMAMDPAVEQERCLLDLVTRSAATKFGSDHDFGAIRSVADFQDRVPLRVFDDFWRDYWQEPFPILDNVTWPGRIPYFAKTSGTTTGATKYIPITKEIVRANEGAGFDLMTYHLHFNPQSRPLSGKSFIIAGSTSLEQLAPGIFGGDVSGVNTKSTPFWVKPRIFPTPELALISNWDEKLEKLSRLALDQRFTMASGMCNWVLVMFDRIRELKKANGTLKGPTFPELQLLIHGGVPMDLYRERLAPHLDGAPVEARELYPTSEGFIACADRGPGEGLRMMLDNKLFLEFVPLEEIDSPNPTRHWAKTIERDIDYALVLSNCAGLWSYMLGDVVRFVDTNPPRMLIMGRTSQKLSPFGEHLIGAEIEEAVQAAGRALGIGVRDYTVGPVLPSGAGETGYHVYIVEPGTALEGDTSVLAARFSNEMDKALLDANYDYACQRTGDAGVGPPRVAWVDDGTFEGWMRGKNKMGGQNKVPRVTAKADRFATYAKELGVELGNVPLDRSA